MKNNYSDLDIAFSIESVKFHVSCLIYGCTFQIIQSHSHGSGCYEIHYIPSGRGRAIMDGQSYELSPGILYVTGPGVVHSQISDRSDPVWEYCIYFYISKMEKHPESLSLTIPQIFLNNRFWFGRDSQNILDTMEQLFREFDQKQMGYQQSIELLLKQLVIKLVRNYKKHNTASRFFPPSNLQERGTRIIEEHFLFDYKNSSLNELASQLGLSPRQTQRLLKKLYGKTYIEKRSEARMSMASTLLTETDQTITDISVTLGFATVEYFSNVFRKFYGMSATEYRKTMGCK